MPVRARFRKHLLKWFACSALYTHPRTQKVPLALLGERQKKTVGEGCNETGAQYINPQESR